MGTDKKTLYINGRFLSQPVTGVQRYARELLVELDAILQSTNSGIEVIVLAPRKSTEIPAYKSIRVRQVGKLKGHAWEQIELPLYSLGGVLFTPGGGAPLIHPRNIITIHDAAVFAAPAGYSFLYREWYRFLYRTLCWTSLRILTDSNFSRSELIRWCGARPDKISVIYLGCGHARTIAADNSILERHHLEKYGYLLAVSSRNPNKNFDGVIRALDFLGTEELEVAIAGGTISHVFNQTSLTADHVKDLGYVSDRELRSLYENAACFVFPSFYEGFGLPPLEALALGCPVVVGNTASLPELFTGIALLCDPRNPQDIAAKIRESIAARGDLAARALNAANADRFTWSKCAQETWAILLAATAKH
jgi:glycosyltransferase involved in cell wall biosynthesis